ncbi:glycoside hydrolase family 16 protein, partial [Saccharata proteae CBS 121410]
MLSHSISILFLCLASYSEARYALSDNYNPANFFDKFEYWTAEDPTHGYVQYVNQSTARSTGLIKNTTLGGIYIGVDTTNTYDPTGPGRPSVRLQSLARYNHGLFVLDLSHIPWGCGAWPAWWTVGDVTQWPKYGEIDIIEGVNTNTNNTNKMYTSEGCTVAGTGELGTMNPLNCYGGCGLTSPDSTSYGAGFNSKQGGVYVMEWTSDYIRIWSFSHSNIPSSLSSGSPDTSQDFGTPVANFQGDCNIDEHFQDHQIVLDITWCGDWAGPTFQNYPSCPLTSGMSSWDSCKQYVANHPEGLSEVYWAIKNMRVYQTA